ncbi:hypothetical protein M422DRAFT_243901 [Sphaerobolus stellatus SS14]|nr:hypothetical protein M422DRAFT_243901 [Sphaerobolus stellatus SS14]
MDAAVGYEKLKDYKEYPPDDYYDQDPKEGCYSLDQDTLLSLIVTDSHLNSAPQNQNILSPLIPTGSMHSQRLVKFFERLLKETIHLKVDPIGEVRVHIYGAAAGYMLSALFGEAILFIMDYTVFRKTNSQVYLYQIHDDLWFWDSDPGKCVTGWKETL